MLTGDLRLALELAAQADEVAVRAGRPAASQVTRKADGSPVTSLDLAIDELVVTRLRASRPHDGILSEERGVDGPAQAARRWIVDPLDGTARMLAGRSDWGTHIVLEIDGRSVLAVMTRPATATRYWATLGAGSWALRGGGHERLRIGAGSEPLRVGGLVEPGSREQAKLSHAASWKADTACVVTGLLRGDLDAVVDDAGDPWDIAPLALLVEQAGGVFSDRWGGRRIDTGWALYGGTHAHAVLRELIDRD